MDVSPTETDGLALGFPEAAQWNYGNMGNLSHRTTLEDLQMDSNMVNILFLKHLQNISKLFYS